MKNIQIVLSDTEYGCLADAAKRAGLPISVHIRRLLLGEKDEFAEAYAEALRRVEALPLGTEFTLKTIFGADWTMSRGTKLTLGKTFYDMVTREKDGIKIAIPLGKDRSNIMQYKRIAPPPSEECPPMQQPPR